MTLTITDYQIIFLVAILLVTILGIAIPVCGARSRYAQTFLSLGNAFGGGVFFSAGMLHMLPDALRDFPGQAACLALNASATDTGTVCYPWAFFTVCSSFLFLLAIEKVLVPRIARFSRRTYAHDYDRISIIDVDVPDERVNYDLHEHGAGDVLLTGSTILVWTLLAALSVHSVLAGLSVGVETNLGSIWVLFIAILAHKTVEAASMSIVVIRASVSRLRAMLILGFFTLCTPVGIAVGIAIRLASETPSNSVAAIFKALASGTFLYVSLLDVLEVELANKRMLELKYLCILLGFGVMAVVAIWT